MRATILTTVTAATMLAATAAEATLIRVTIENTAVIDGVHLTPLWVGFHDGTSFDTFDVGGTASPGVEAVAELGTVATIGAEQSAAQTSAVGGALGNPAGFAGAPIIEPGESATAVFDLDSTENRFFQFLSMVLPSNDTFIGNPDALELFNAAGRFTAPAPIVIDAAIALDAGTEANDLDDGPAFVVGQTDTDGTVTADSIALATGIGSIGAGVGLPNGVTIDPDAFAAFFSGGIDIGTITITQVPLPPAVAPMLALMGAAAVVGYRRRS